MSGALSSDPELAIGTQIVVVFKRPSDGQKVESRAGVRDHLTEGGLWRGRPAALIAFPSPIELEEGENLATVEPLSAAPAPRSPLANRDEPATGPYSEPPQRIGDDSTTEEQPAVAALGLALRGKGLGKRKLAGRLRRPSPFGHPSRTSTPEPAAEAPTSKRAPDLAHMEAAFFEDEPTPPSADLSVPIEDEDTTDPPGTGFLDEFLSAVEPEASFGGLEPPPFSNTDSQRDKDEDEDEDEEFIRRFSSAAVDFGIDIPDDEPVDHFMMQETRAFESEPGTLPPQFIAPASIPGAPVPVAPPMRLESTGESPPVGGLSTRRHRAGSGVGERPLPQSESASAVPASSASSRPPWEKELDDKAVASLMPRNARIASTVDVTFWARGRRNNAMADNFSREGLFLTYSGTPPVRGAIVRIEFPLEGSDESVPVRFNAEVRWHRSDRPGVGLADGFGVQILTFETPRDRARYAELLDAIMALGPASAPAEGFAWGHSEG